jgi:hypothetical protein
MKDIWFLYAILLAFPGLILLAVIVKYFEVMKARNWSSVPGIVTVSTSEARTVKKGVGEDADTEKRNFAKIVYEYKVANHTFHGDRVTIGEDLGNSEVAETIAKYPKGKPVTVYYNPNKRTESVLERDLPAFVWKGALIIIAVLVAMIFGGVIGIERLSKFMSSVVRNPAEAPFVTGCLAFGFFTALFVYAFQKQAATEKRWPIVPGRIESVSVTHFVSRSTDDDRTRETVMYRPQVVYSYAVAGVTYRGERISGNSVSSSSETAAKKAAAKYTEGHPVEVHYDPKNAAQSSVGPGMGWARLLWIIPALFVAGAYFIAR